MRADLSVTASFPLKIETSPNNGSVPLMNDARVRTVSFRADVAICLAKIRYNAPHALKEKYL